jgi:CheY-like chemotaxis protein
VRRVLVVDDSRVIREALEAALEPYGCEVHHADNGAVALQQLKGSHFDLVLVDVNMPVLDGISLVRILRAQGITTKVVLITAGTSSSVITPAVKLGVSDYVSKPFQPERIRVVVARALGLDPTALEIRPARVLVQHPDEGLAERVQALLPSHVQVDASGAVFARALELAEQRSYAAILLDSAVLGAEATAAAALLRELLPLAAIFALREGAPRDGWWSPEGALDGVLPLPLEADAARGFLYSNFLRALVFREGAVLHAAGFVGDERHLPAYFCALERAVAARCGRELALADIVIDLTRAPRDASAVAALVARLHERLDQIGAAPAYRVRPDLLDELGARPELGRVVILR